MSQAAAARWRDEADDAQPDRPGVRRALGRASVPLLALAGYVATAVLLFADAWRAPFDRLIGLPGDPGIFLWYLRWPGFALSHGMNPLLTNYLDYPAGVNLMWNVSVPLPALLLTPVTSALGMVFAYNLGLTLAVALSGWTAFLAIRRFVGHDLAAVGGGMLYAFSPYLMSHAQEHLQASLVMLPPLFLIALDEILVRQRRRPIVGGISLGVLAAAQLLISEEMLAVVMLSATLGFILLAGMHPTAIRPRLRHALQAGAWAAGSGLILVAFPLAVQFFGPQRLNGALQPSWVYANDLLNFVVPTPVQLLDPAPLHQIVARFTGDLFEWNGYLGIPLLVVTVLVAVRCWNRPLVRFAIGLSTMLALLSLGTTLHIGGWVTAVPVVALAIAFIPLRRALPLRAMVGAFCLGWVALAIAPLWKDLLPGRLMLPVDLLAGLLLAVFIASMLTADASRMSISRPSTIRRLALSGTLLVAVAITLFPRIPYPATALTMPSFFLAGGDVSRIPAGSVALVLPFSRLSQADAMVWQAASGMRFRMPEGYAYVPAPHLWEISPPPSATQSLMTAVADGQRPPVPDGWRRQVLDEWHHWQIGNVVVGPMPHEAQIVDLISLLLHERPIPTGGVYLWRISDAAGD